MQPFLERIFMQSAATSPKRLIQSIDRITPEGLVATSINRGFLDAEKKQLTINQLTKLVDQVRTCLVLTDNYPDTSPDKSQYLEENCAELLTKLSEVRKGKKSVEELVRFAQPLQIVNDRVRAEVLQEQLNKLEGELNGIKRRVVEANTLVASSKKASDSIEDLRGRSKSTLEDQRLFVNESRRTANRVKSQETKAQFILAQMREKLQSTEKLSNEAGTNARSVAAIQIELDRLAGHVNTHIANMRATEARMDESARNYSDEKQRYIEELKEVKQQADEVLLRATAGSLYKAYGVRQAEIEKKVAQHQKFLIASVICAVICSLGVWYVAEKQSWPLANQYIAKLGILSPFVFIIWFLTAQYNRERLLAEEYANKANMSVSYPAFRGELIDLTSNGSDALREQAVLAAIDITREIFRDPLDAFKRNDRRSPSTSKQEKPAGASSNTSDDAVMELTNRIGKVFDAAANLVEKAGKVVHLPIVSETSRD